MIATEKIIPGAQPDTYERNPRQRQIDSAEVHFMQMFMSGQ